MWAGDMLCASVHTRAPLRFVTILTLNSQGEAYALRKSGEKCLHIGKYNHPSPPLNFFFFLQIWIPEFQASLKQTYLHIT